MRPDSTETKAIRQEHTYKTLAWAKRFHRSAISGLLADGAGSSATTEGLCLKLIFGLLLGVMPAGQRMNAAAHPAHRMHRLQLVGLPVCRACRPGQHRVKNKALCFYYFCQCNSVITMQQIEPLAWLLECVTRI